MTFFKVMGTAAILFFGTTIGAYGQKEEKEEAPRAAAPQQHAQPAKAPAQQPQQHAQPARAQAQPQQRAPQAKAPAQQAKTPAQQAKGEARPAQERAPQAKAPAQQAKGEAQRPEARAPQAKSEAQAKGEAQPQRSPQQAQAWQQQRGWASKGGAWQPHTSFQQGRDQNWASDHRDWAQRGGYGGAYIPQASFGLYFGSSHFFHIGIMPVMYMGYPRFAYGGYSFLVVDPWPGSWQLNWYASDDVYIDYDSGYYLYDRRYPGVRLAVTVAL